MRVALIVATYGRRAELVRLLDSLVVQAYRDFDVIIIDQNQGGLVNIIAPFADRLRLIHKIARPVGVSAARNIGLGLLTNQDIVAFPDDDCWYEPDTIQNMVSFFNSYADVGCVIGRGKGAHRGRVNRYSVFSQSPTWLFALRANMVNAIGGFDETIGPGAGSLCLGGEDTDYLLRGMLKGMKVMREPNIRIHHPDLLMNKMASNKVYMYGVARMTLLWRYRYPFWFRLVNMVYPLVRGFLSPHQLKYWLNMFRGRLGGNPNVAVERSR